MDKFIAKVNDLSRDIETELNTLRIKLYVKAYLT